MTPPLSRSYLDFAHGDALDTLNNAFEQHEDGVHERRFRDALLFTINTYATSHDNAGHTMADLIGDLPRHRSPGIPDAFVGLHILHETHAAVAELLADDAEFRDMIRGEDRTDDDTDRTIRDDARQFDRDFHVDLGRRLEANQITTDAADERVRDAAYEGNSREIDEEVRASRRDTLDAAPREITAPAHDSPPEPPKDAANKDVPRPPEDPAMRHFGEQAKPITVQVPDFGGQAPNTVFRGSTRWLGTQLIAVAAGSTKHGSFPRIAHLLDAREAFPDYGVTTAELRRLADEIRAGIDRLRPPHDEGGGFLSGPHDHDPDPDAAIRHLRELLGGVTADDWRHGPDPDEDD